MNPNLRTQRGLSLIEPLVTATIASVLAIATLPGLEEAKDRRRLDSAVAQMESELQYARSAAVARSETIRALFQSTPEGSCYVIHNGASGDCTCTVSGPAQCVADVEVLRSVSLPRSSGLRLASSAREIGFDAALGTVTPTTTLQWESRGGRRTRLVLNVMGRIRSCSVGSAVEGLPQC